ncbi:hypothetical protein T310_9609 [Rasamsonia emersonii CBS 393.64]|uniref:ubiquitinyl hydrolase 1 n=1 Tax=Rasamsonia emersonii (strain ATCC 16479 / CBS 393.64 / IMI 116815) TaxID=1408163 RepID=A0A0F4YF59_RASE3|nr:hypothetical protein T310_9609 [Rasamsonia emersonii CBS 393.64]KKA16789.1 hypothetical protein T310_9609 [Rasamsonia emersonii CBS 393.64]
MSSGTADPYLQSAIETEWKDSSTRNTFPKGLQNNAEEACYRNAALVLFFHTPCLLNWAADFVANFCDPDPSHQDIPCVICLFHRLAEIFWSPDADVRQDDAAFRGYVGMLWDFTAPGDWQEGEQQDVREYMECVLQSFQQEATLDQRLIIIRGGKPILPVFTSVVERHYACEACQSVESSSKPDDLLFLGGQVSDDGVNNKERKKRGIPMCPMDTVINSYMRPQQLSGKPCRNCKKDKDMFEWSPILETPDILFINVNRHGVNGKVTTPIKIQMGIDIESWYGKASGGNGPNQCTSYELYGVLFHIGDSDSGHYVAVVKGPVGGWMLFDDESRQHISEEGIEELQDELTTSYIFAYRKTSQHTLQKEPVPLDNLAPAYEQASGYELASGYEQYHRQGELQSSGENAQDPVGSVNGTPVWLEGTIKINERDLEGRIRQQLPLRSEFGPLVKQVRTRSKAQPVVLLITLREGDSDVVLEGTLKGNVKPKEKVVQEQDTTSKKPGRKTRQTASGTSQSATSKKRKKTPEQPESRDESQETRQATEKSISRSKPAASRKRKRDPEQQETGDQASTAAKRAKTTSRGRSRQRGRTTARNRN